MSDDKKTLKRTCSKLVAEWLKLSDDTLDALAVESPGFSAALIDLAELVNPRAHKKYVRRVEKLMEK